MPALERNPEVLASTPDEELDHGSEWRGIPRGPWQLAWRLDFPEATQACSQGLRPNSRGIPSFLPKFLKNQEILSSTRDEALVHCSVLREISPSLLSLERVLDTLEATQEVPQHTRLLSRGTPMVPTQLMKSPGFPPHLEMRVHFPASSGKEYWRSHHTSRGGGLNLKIERYSRDSTTILKDPDVRIHSR